MAKPSFDRRTQDVGNILVLEHVNVTVPDQQLAHLFYVTGLGLTRDPYMDFGLRNMWINAGPQQFHLPVSKAQVLRGRVGLAIPSLDELERRLERSSRYFDGTRARWKRAGDQMDVTCPWGNRLICHGPDVFGMALGIPYVEFDVPPDSAPGITRFYRKIMNAPARLTRGGEAPAAEVAVGNNQVIRFVESEKRPRRYDGHHIAIYVADFSRPHRRLDALGLITEESDASQYRFQAIVDPDTGARLFDIEHEVRSLHHPMYERHLAVRDPSQGFFNYRRGRDVFVDV